jgi:hypothetical protein
MHWSATHLPHKHQRQHGVLDTRGCLSPQFLKLLCTGCGRNTWRFWKKRCEWNLWRGEFVFERPSSEMQSISVSMELWSVEHRVFAVETIFKKPILSLWLSWYFVGTSIFIGTSVPSYSTSSSGDISRSWCTKRNQGQQWTWNGTLGTKWQQFLPPCRNEWCRTSRKACGNVLTRDATSQTLHSGSECCN